MRYLSCRQKNARMNVDPGRPTVLKDQFIVWSGVHFAKFVIFPVENLNHSPHSKGRQIY